MDLLERLWSKVQTADGCWRWLASLDTNGYGQFVIKGTSRRPAHKVVYELLRGKVPKDMQLDHLCRNRACVNPEHLEIVTGKVNRERGNGPDALNRRKMHCLKGHEFNEANTRIYFHRGIKRRQCKKCNRNYHKLEHKSS